MSLSPSPEVQQFFSDEEVKSLTLIPKHVAIIMDGNRRWARKQEGKIMDPLAGHWEGARNLFRIVNAAVELGVEELTLYGFSTENWKRPPREVERLLWVIGKALTKYADQLIEYGIALNVIGDWKRFPLKLSSLLEKVIVNTACGQRLKMNLALNYGGRNEIVRAIQRISEAVKRGECDPQEIDDKYVESFLDTASSSDPALLIRTSGEERISNFLLWQTAYTEFYTSSMLWPEFAPQDLLLACQHYQKRKRRMGK